MVLIFDHLDYREYLLAWIAGQATGGHGFRRKIAQFLNCQGAFVSQVLHKTAHFSLEHGFKLNKFLQHSAEEADYFLLMMLYQRAGSEEMRDYFRGKLAAIHKSRLVLSNRIPSKSPLSFEDQARYYSAWYFGAIRVALTIPGLQTKAKLLEKLKISPFTLASALDFLLRTGLIKEKNGRYTPGERHLHLANTSPLISKHHSNWRLQALNSLGEEKENDLHYSLAMTLSKEDVVKLKARIVEFIEELQAVVRPSDAQELCGFCLDWFEI